MTELPEPNPPVEFPEPGQVHLPEPRTAQRLVRQLPGLPDLPEPLERQAGPVRWAGGQGR